MLSPLLHQDRIDTTLLSTQFSSWSKHAIPGKLLCKHAVGMEVIKITIDVFLQGRWPTYQLSCLARQFGPRKRTGIPEGVSQGLATPQARKVQWECCPCQIPHLESHDHVKPSSLSTCRNNPVMDISQTLFLCGNETLTLERNLWHLCCLRILRINNRKSRSAQTQRVFQDTTIRFCK